ncbi:MAG TPA: bifunctional DNA-binding transcriptional regulator/O6-methylguanine-DNA methyltransferase Ada [Ktedonobacteraceae bacterium]
MTADEDTYWQAVMEHDSQANGTFVYGVRSTRIYCKPSCPSRRPQRRQVVFFTEPAAAEQAGFRACLRCQPRIETPDTRVALARQACRYIEQHLDEPLRLEQLGAQLGLSKTYVQKLFKRVIGISPRQYAEALRLGQLKCWLKEGVSVTRTLYEVGYSSSSRLYERTPEQLGMTPTAYKRGGAGMAIAYTIVDSPLGRLLVAATARGICRIGLDNSDEVLESTLHHEYPAAEIHRDGNQLRPWLEEFVHYLAGTQADLDLPIDIRATAFQWRVWEQLRTIPSGQTRSYSALAQAIGQPQARRAVAQACKQNPVPLVIPCHRVVRASGDPGGYRWGVERKRRLLEQERAMAASTLPEPADV